MTITCQVHIIVLFYCVAFLAIAVFFAIILFGKRRENILDWEIEQRLSRKGSVRRAAKRAGMSFREYSIKHFS